MLFFVLFFFSLNIEMYTFFFFFFLTQIVLGWRKGKGVGVNEGGSREVRRSEQVSKVVVVVVVGW